MTSLMTSLLIFFSDLSFLIPSLRTTRYVYIVASSSLEIRLLSPSVRASLKALKILNPSRITAEVKVSLSRCPNTALA